MKFFKKWKFGKSMFTRVFDFLNFNKRAISFKYREKLQIALTLFAGTLIIFILYMIGELNLTNNRYLELQQQTEEMNKQHKIYIDTIIGDYEEQIKNLNIEIEVKTNKIEEQREKIRQLEEQLNIKKQLSSESSVSRGDYPPSHNAEKTGWMNFQMTHYQPFCSSGCIGITATGVDVSNTIYHNGMRVIAVDPSVIPLGSTVEIKYEDGRIIQATAQDTGGAIKGNIVDLLVENTQIAIREGRKNVQIRILK